MHYYLYYNLLTCPLLFVIIYRKKIKIKKK